MNSLTKVLLEDLLEADKKKITAIYGGGFKPPTKGHFDVIQKATEQNPEIDEFIIYVGSGTRDGIGQAESIMIWELYKKYLPLKVRVEPVKAPVGDILRYAKEHPDEEVLWVIGARENNPEDFMDIASRTRTMEKYPNLELRVIQTSGGVSGTAARKAVRDNNKEQFYHLIPDIEEKDQVWDIVSPIVTEGVIDNVKEKLKKFISAVKQESKETKAAFSLLIKSAKGEIDLTEEQKKEIGAQLKDVLKLVGLTAIATLPGGFIAAALIKLFKAEHLITPSSMMTEDDPKKGTGKKPEGSGRRLYTDEDPKDTVRVKFKTKEDIVDTLNKTSFKAKSHARQSQVINLIHQRVRAAYGKAKDPEVKSRLKRALDYIEKRKEASKKKTERLRKMKEASDPQAGTALPYGSGFAPVKEYGNTGSSTPKVYIVKADGTYKEVPIGILSKIPNLTYDMGGGETNYYPEKNIVIVDNIPVEQFAKEPGEIKNEKIYVEYNLNQPFSFPKANKILAAQIVYHLNDIKSFAKTVNDSLKTGGTFQFFSDLMNKQDKEFLNYLSSEYGFGLPKNLSPYKGGNLPLKKGDYIEPVISYIYLVTDADGNTAKVSVTKEGRWWKYDKIEGDIDFKPIKWSVEPEYKYNNIAPSKEDVLDSFSKTLETDIVDFKKLNENLNELVTATDIICDNCGWEWAKKDGGDDLYICHKCGHDNTPKQLNENTIPSIDIKEKLNQINQYMISKGYNIEPLPSVEIIDNDKENAEDYLGKTAYYDPNEKKIVLYTYGRHPKDISRSYTHEMIHHIQNLEDRLGNITTTNTLEDDHLDKIEQEANLKGTMTFRNFTDSLQEKKDPFGLLENIINEGRYDSIVTQLARYTIKGWKDDQEHGEPSSRLEFEVGPGKDLEYGDLEFLYKGTAIFAGIESYAYNGYAKSRSGEVGIEFAIPTSELPKMWEQIYNDVTNTLRHEIEHLTQDGKNVKPNKAMASDSDLRNQLDTDGNTVDYYLLPKEIDANLQGLYLKAKKTKQPFDKVVDSYLKYNLNLSLDDQEKVKNAWRPRIKALSLPKI